MCDIPPYYFESVSYHFDCIMVYVVVILVAFHRIEKERSFRGIIIEQPSACNHHLLPCILEFSDNAAASSLPDRRRGHIPFLIKRKKPNIVMVVHTRLEEPTRSTTSEY